MDKPLRLNEAPALGPWQGVWETWCEVDEEVKSLAPDHFVVSIMTQILEVRECLANPDPNRPLHAAEEMADIISVTLNWLRNFGLTPEQIAEVVKARGAKRYAGQTQVIIDKYRAKYGI